MVALANWPGHIEAGTTVDGLIHAVDLFPTFVALAGGRLDRGKPLDGMDVWTTISRGEPSPRTEVVYNIEPSAAGSARATGSSSGGATPPVRGALQPRRGPVREDRPGREAPDKVAALQERVNELAAGMAPPLFTPAAVEATLKLPPAFPEGGR